MLRLCERRSRLHRNVSQHMSVLRSVPEEKSHGVKGFRGSRPSKYTIHFVDGQLSPNTWKKCQPSLTISHIRHHNVNISELRMHC